MMTASFLKAHLVQRLVIDVLLRLRILLNDVVVFADCIRSSGFVDCALRCVSVLREGFLLRPFCLLLVVDLQASLVDRSSLLAAGRASLLGLLLWSVGTFVLVIDLCVRTDHIRIFHLLLNILRLQMPLSCVLQYRFILLLRANLLLVGNMIDEAAFLDFRSLDVLGSSLAGKGVTLAQHSFHALLIVSCVLFVDALVDHRGLD